MKQEIAALKLEESSCDYEEIDKGHGRLEQRKIWISDKLKNYLNFPHIEQVFLIERSVEFCKSGKTRHEYAYGVTSMKNELASAKDILGYNRGHWGIENKEHYVRDMSFDEDRSTIRTKNGPHMMACLRNFAISLLRLVGFESIASGLRSFGRSPSRAITAVGL